MTGQQATDRMRSQPPQVIVGETPPGLVVGFVGVGLAEHTWVVCVSPPAVESEQSVGRHGVRGCTHHVFMLATGEASDRVLQHEAIRRLAIGPSRLVDQPGIPVERRATPLYRWDARPTTRRLKQRLLPDAL
ncbi:hypothetical protein [Streptomyces sp. NPDC058424]|uniref:hypothetical protein n=1 Tax=Streptomyces sp. NPDC058424 TaxID=3346491 RepID=UPI0036544C48